MTTRAPSRRSTGRAPGYFTEASVIRRVHRERAVALAGPRALLMQAAHPVAFTGFFLSTGALDDPHGRLRRTAAVLDTILYGRREDADRVTAQVRAVHHRMRGILPGPAGSFPAGTPWAADDPDLLLWIIATLADSALLVHERCVGSLGARERQAYWDDHRVVGALFGLPGDDMPATVADLRAYVRDMLEGDVLHIVPQARQLAIDVVMRPPLPPAARPLRDLANLVTIGLLPARLRREYGFGWDPVRGLGVRIGAEYVKRVLLPLMPDAVRRARREAA
jgi:uncharacterized protein (DUF2236 family)